jgi:hypothetical protein
MNRIKLETTREKNNQEKTTVGLFPLRNTSRPLHHWMRESCKQR